MCPNRAQIERSQNMEIVGIASVAAITVIAYLIGEIGQGDRP